jgi:hypothetical protein
MKKNTKGSRNKISRRGKNLSKRINRSFEFEKKQAIFTCHFIWEGVQVVIGKSYRRGGTWKKWKLEKNRDIYR